LLFRRVLAIASAMIAAGLALIGSVPELVSSVRFGTLTCSWVSTAQTTRCLLLSN